MAKLTYFPLLMDRWVSGTRELTFEQKGFYIDLLVYLYDSGGAIKDEAHAARITGCDPRTSRRLLADLRPKFYRRSDGLRHKLVTEILKNGGKVKYLGHVEKLTELPLKPDPDLKNPPIVPPLSESAKPKPKRAPKRAAFRPPDVSDVAAYCEERKNGIDPDAWVAHYQANGWRVGRNPMKDWQAAVRTWERREREQSTQPKPKNGSSRPKSFEAMVDSLGAELGMSAKPGEAYREYYDRLLRAKRNGCAADEDRVEGWPPWGAH